MGWESGEARGEGGCFQRGKGCGRVAGPWGRGWAKPQKKKRAPREPQGWGGGGVTQGNKNKKRLTGPARHRRDAPGAWRTSPLPAHPLKIAPSLPLPNDCPPHPPLTPPPTYPTPDPSVAGCDVTSAPASASCLQSTLQPGSSLVASGYCLYSSSTFFCLTLGAGVNIFTLDPNIGEFVLTHPNVQVRGPAGGTTHPAPAPPPGPGPLPS